MDDHFQREPEFTHSTTCESESAPPASGMFSHLRNFTVRGKNLTNITNNYAGPSLPSDFRMIPMGDIDLQHEVRLNNSMVVVDHRRKSARPCIKETTQNRNGGVILQDICPCGIQISFRSVAPQIQMGYMPRFSMMISYL
ncbi:hypothetical protein MSAN_02133300 [Mycena sanguinolenta]|uniref:Uncharacterized protein n=1 Tax=Mycena sanguinolenta TaxID=230812 RepID=A0A8H7CLM5_9AGAR|nr:hypothetical protein MSAN_02133300 [Mycena sanguinolenta]